MQLIKDFTTDHIHRAVRFYLDMNKEGSYSRLVIHLRTLLESGEMFNSILSKFYGQYKKPKETED